MRIGAIVLVLAALAGCADPRLPPGGPPDRTPPMLVETTPEAGAVNVTDPTVRLVFSEYVDQASFTRALSIFPTPEGRLRFKWHKRRVDIRFPEDLRPNTTYVLTIDTNLRDTRSVALTKPITLAFSTGPVINKGRIAGRLRDARQGDGIAGRDIFAYAAPDSAAPDTLPEHPDYRTQTDENGHFTFSYLNEQPYFVIALQDRNRNYQPDLTEPFAVPPRPVIFADTVQAADSLTWFATMRDTVPPVVQRLRSRSSRRLELRFSESIRLVALTPEDWHVADSLTARNVPVEAVYMLPADPRQLYLLTDSLAATPHQLWLAATVTDSSGNLVRPDTLRFTPSATADTMQLRFLDFVPKAPSRNTASSAADPYRLLPNRAPGVQFNQWLPRTRLSEIVSLQDTTGQAVPFDVETENGTTYRFQLTPPLQPGRKVQVRVDGRQAGGVDTVYTRTFQRIAARELGGLSGIVAAGDTSGTIVIELYGPNDAAASDPYATTHPDTTGHFSFSDLPEGSYRFRIFLDRNDNDRWDGGWIIPYRPAEPVIWNTEPASVRARWDSALKDTLRIPSRF